MSSIEETLKALRDANKRLDLVLLRQKRTAFILLVISIALWSLVVYLWSR